MCTLSTNRAWFRQDPHSHHQLLHQTRNLMEEKKLPHLSQSPRKSFSSFVTTRCRRQQESRRQRKGRLQREIQQQR